MTFSTTKGCDVSYYQAAIDFRKMKNYGMNFVILRCGYAAVKDTRFDEYMGQVAGVLPIGVYHYYDPIVNPFDQAKKVIAILAPYQERVNRVWLDFEFYWAGAYSTPEHWLNYRNVIEMAGYKTGIYTRATWWDSRVGTYAAELGKRPLWAAQYNTVLNMIPKGWTKAMLWQKGTPVEGLAAGVSSKEIDLDIWNDEFDFMAEWGGVTSTTSDTITTPHDGMKQITGTRNGWKFHLFILDTAKFDFELISTPALETVKSVALRKLATLATNAGEWNDRDASLPSYLKPTDYTVSNGQIIVTRDKIAARPSLIIKSDDLPKINHINEIGTQQAFTGLRYIVGTLADPTKWNTEGHSRTCFGLDLSTNVMILLSEGVYPNQGLTLVQAAQLLKEYGAVVAFDGGGGGDVGGVLDGQDLIKPENIVNGVNVYRALPMIFCVYAKGVSTMPQYKIIWSSGVSKRLQPTTSSNSTGVVLPVGTIVDVLQDNIPDKTYPTDTTKLWCKFTDGTYGASIYGAGSVRMQLVAAPPPPTSTFAHHLEVILDGVVEYKKDFN